MDNAVAKIIIEQLGNRGLSMIGAKELVAGPTSLTFKVGRNAKTVSHIRVVLMPSDTYTVEALRVRKSKGVPVCTTVQSQDDMHAEDLKATIESFTGMYMSL
jgi:hypothetical protein